MLGLEMALRPQQPTPPNPQNHMHQQSQLVAYAHHESDHNNNQQHHTQTQPSVKQVYQFAAKPKPISQFSDEDEPLGLNPDDINGDGKRKFSPWQRMKWTDSMVRLLIMAVYYIGDEVGIEVSDPIGKKKAGCGGGGGGGGATLQKKGKWKSVSNAMMEKGFYVSPQQCEDKFNDLNKRYKRVNDILGKGTACRVVENQNLLETMDLSSKLKDEAKKLLNSKHLFFREMCAYHSSGAGGGACGGVSGAGAGAAGGANNSTEANSELSQIQHHQQQPQQKKCSHSSDHNPQIQCRSIINEPGGLKLGRPGSDGEEEDDDDSDSVSDSDDNDNDDEQQKQEVDESNSRGQQNGGHHYHHHHHHHGHISDNNKEGNPPAKKPRRGLFTMSPSPLMQQLSSDVISVIQDRTKGTWEKKQWMKMRLKQLEEQQVNYQYKSFELEKQRLKWMKFSSKKERELERAKLENERRRLENERMVLLMRQKELELRAIQQQQQQQHHNSSNKTG